MGFVIQWLWYLLAFAVGSAVAWVLTVLTIRHTSRKRPSRTCPASREIGAR